MATVTPYTIWPLAEFSDVDMDQGPTIPNVPIEQIYWTPAKLKIQRSQYPNGVVLLNETPLPSHAQSIDLEQIVVPSNENEIDVDILSNAGWPHGKVIIMD